MAIVLDNGVSLPDIPADVQASYPYVHIAGNIIYETYFLVVKPIPCGFLSAEVSGLSEDYFWGEAEATYRTYILADDAWTMDSTNSVVGEFSGQMAPSHTDIAPILWANYDIPYVVADTEGNYAFGTEIYFQSSVVNLPDIPADILADYPYAVILNETYDSETFYYLMAWTEPFVFLSIGEESAIFSGTNIDTATFIEYDLVDAEWQFYRESPAGDGVFPIGNYGSFAGSLLWSNHDILTATAFNTDTGEVTVGTEIYFLSSVVSYESQYTAPSTWFKGMADQVRKISGVTKRYTRDEMLTVLKAAKAGGGCKNGTAWTQSNITSGRFYSVHNANGIWVAGSNNGNGFYYSTDGMTWTQSNITDVKFNSVHNANGIWVAGSNSNGLYYSTDGMTWTKSNITSGSFKPLYNANGIWVAGGNGLYYSTDGKTWTQSNITSGDSMSLYNANGIWVAGVYSSGLYYSTDGMTWTQSNITSGTFDSLYNANGIWVAENIYNHYYSTDGKTWTQNNSTSYYAFFSSIYNANGIWVGAGSGLSYSIDGITWTQSNITSVDSMFYSVYNANGIWVAGSNNSNGLCYSTDGKTWTQSNITSGDFYSLYNANGIWVAGSRENGLYYSV